jgi:amino acid transporter
MSFLKTLLGRRLASSESEEARIGVVQGLPVLGLDGLASAAYGPEAALAILIPLGAAGLGYIRPITLMILLLLVILYLSYRQTIAAYPNGGGAYVVARHNLGNNAGLLAAASLLLDYILNVAVGISAGVGALVSAVPALHDHILALCLVILVVITIVNLRGLRESSVAFAIPTYLFVVSLAAVIVIGVFRVLSSHGHPTPLVAPPPLAAAAGTAGLWMLLRSFASGCTAMTGVEAVSNGVTVFREPQVRYAQRTLTAIVAILGFLLAGIAYLTHAYGIGAMDQERPGYQSVLSALIAAVLGRGIVYYITVGSVLAVLSLSANTSFAGFPRLCRLIAEDDYLPHSFANVGRRLVYSIGITVLSLIAAALLLVFGGITDRLIPLFAVGAFGAFTLSQAGMVVHWIRSGARRHLLPLAINAIGALTTGVALTIIIIAKFTEGAWITILLVPASMLLFRGIRRHYDNVSQQIAPQDQPIELATTVVRPVVVVPIKAWDNLAEKAVRFGMTVSDDVLVVHVYSERETADALRARWSQQVEEPMRAAGCAIPKLVLLESPYRRLFTPILNFVEQLRQQRDGMIAVILPDLVEGRWWEYLLHTHRAGVLRSLLLLKGNQRVVVVSVPWYLERRSRRRRDASARAIPRASR